MEIVEFKEIEEELLNNRNKYIVFNSLDMKSHSFTKLFQRARDIALPDDFYDCLNLINNQGITKMDIRTGFYFIGSNSIPLIDLANSEKLFVIFYLSKFLELRVCLVDCISSLTYSTFEKFIRVFRDNDYISIVCRYRDDYLYYK